MLSGFDSMKSSPASNEASRCFVAAAAQGLGITGWIKGALLVLATICACPAFAYDTLYSGDFEPVTDVPASDAEAARFLTMATFGPTAADIAQVRRLGYSAWIEQQLSMPTSLQRPYVEQIDGIPQLPNPGQGDRLQEWTRNALNAPDQLRQRLAWAFSQIMVATYQQSKLVQDPVALAEYYDVLARDSAGYFDDTGAFHPGTYENLLYDVTRSPAMGKMLTYLRNKAGDPALGTLPDENYAREVMQLFSIGLILRNQNFTPILDGDGQPIPSYEQATVAAYAQVFTGWSYTSGFNSNPYRFNWSAADYLPMVCYEVYHDNSNTKTLLSYTGDYGAGSDAFVLPANNGCENDLDQGLLVIARHPNVAPFISRQLIQRLTTSNPTPAYVGRVTQVFRNNGHGVRGDLGAVARAILLDREAAYPTPTLPAPYVFGKLREPLLKLTALYRYYNAAAQNGLYSLSPGVFSNYEQIPLGAPSVFNFYQPDYQPPGELADSDLFGPEFQITNAGSIFNVANNLRIRANTYLGNPSNTAQDIAVDLRGLAALAADPAALVAQVNHDLMYGSMSAHMQSTLISMVSQLSAADPYNRVTGLLQVVLASPEFAIQK
jgi:uncharacterized protein (DUF1800 family)